MVLLSLKHAADRAPDELREELRGVQESVRASLDEVGQVARRLRPGVLEDLGLQSALSALSSDFSQSSGVPRDPQGRSRPARAERGRRVGPLRIAQEGLTNAARHACASRVELSLTAEPSGLELRISDNGRGGVRQDGAGIRGMRERAMLIGARLTVTSPQGGGTDVRLTVPAENGQGSR